ncbi:nucleotide exchange factor GrpE [Corynebacterium pyruviciproducens]|uniref:nucleotide exchange factor GrpE n=1 Tax=Corynebacterium pyruviciproducens TaxID=598660 RepID=UPI002454825A|nr:nucleotide exchange factor GrpE [Corynebacterium pyruviciproducens]MDH4657574.1 nucleotide exchange factor GrpE [Corynebacterium pyruviciproducens]
MSDPENREHPTPEEPEVTESAVDGNGGNEPVVDAEVADTAADAAAAADTAEQAPEESPEDKLTALLAERTDDLQRVSAEYANYRKRAAQDRQTTIDHTTSSVVLKFLPVFDDLDLAEQHGDLNEGPLKAFAGKLTGILGQLKVTPFGAVGDEFNPEIHEAVQDLSSGDEKRIGVVLRKGYMIDDRLLRTAMVIIDDVDKAQPDTADESATEADAADDSGSSES